MEDQKLFSDSSSTRSRLHSSNMYENSIHHVNKKQRSNLHNGRSRDELKCKEDLYERELVGDDYHNHIEEQLQASQEINDVESSRDESRKRRQAILDKYKNKLFHQPKVEVDQAKNIVGNNSKLVVDVKIKNILYENSINETVSRANALEHGPQKGNSKHASDLFCNDIFANSPLGGWKMQKGERLAINSYGFHDNWDDIEGRYHFHLGEILDGRFCIIKSLGSGVFSTVVKAHDSKASENSPNEVAIKIIRNNDTMYKSGLNEVVILKHLAEKDAKNKKHCVQLLSSFEYRNHLCLVFESSHMNLRNILKKYGRNIGINLIAIQTYTRKIFIALQHLQNCGVLHCDIKLDNILVNDSMDVRKSSIKLCDFGSSMFVGKNEITPYMVSRYYRAPEIILGLPYNHALDIWSVACCLYELYTGKILFPGSTNNEMLQLHMKLMGAFPKKMLKKALFQKCHFDNDFNFIVVEEDLVTKMMVKRIIRNDGFVKFKGMNLEKSGKYPKLVAQFNDLLTKMLTLDPNKRMTIVEALNHPFILK